jgi:hypothetical protein
MPTWNLMMMMMKVTMPMNNKGTARISYLSDIIFSLLTYLVLIRIINR